MYTSIYSSRAIRERVVAERDKWDWPKPRVFDRARARREQEDRYKDVRLAPNKRGVVHVTRYRWDGEWSRWWAQYSWKERHQPKNKQQLSLFGEVHHGS